MLQKPRLEVSVAYDTLTCVGQFVLTKALDVKESGYGREGSMYGLAEYQVIKSVTIGNLDL